MSYNFLFFPLVEGRPSAVLSVCACACVCVHEELAGEEERDIYMAGFTEKQLHY